MKKLSMRLALLLCLVMVATLLTACGGGEDEKADAITGTWKQTDEVDGDWTFTFSKGSQVKFVGNTTGFESEGTYTLDEANKKLKINLEGWSAEKEFDYTLEGDVLDIKETYTSYHLIKQK